MDKSQLGAAIIAFSVLMMISPFGLGRAITAPTQFIGAISAVNIFYGIVFLIAGIAVFFIKETEEQPVEQ